MVDMSHYDEAENLEKTERLTKECHAKGIAVEAESGRINGGEDGIADTGDLEGTTFCCKTKPRHILISLTSTFHIPRRC
jgi:fructose-bisphosphate aldolase class II